MTYAVQGLRQLLYGGSVSGTWRDAGILLLGLIVALGLTAPAARRQRVWTVTRLEPELVL